jgi:hypothetical protein
MANDNDNPVEEASPADDDHSAGVEVTVEAAEASPPPPAVVPTVTLPKDHFTLAHPTTTIRYRQTTQNAARIIEDADQQYILEEADDKDGKHEITIRQLHDTSEGVRFLRATYTLATAFWTGFLFVFAVQILLFVFLDLAIQFGITSGDNIKWGAGLGVLFSVMPMVHSLAAAMVIAGVYIMVSPTLCYLFPFRSLLSLPSFSLPFSLSLLLLRLLLLLLEIGHVTGTPLDPELYPATVQSNHRRLGVLLFLYRSARHRAHHHPPHGHKRFLGHYGPHLDH